MRRKSYIQKITPFIDRMRDCLKVEPQPVPPVPPGPEPDPGAGGGEIDPENPTVVDFGSETVVEPIDPEHPGVRILSVGSDCTVEGNTLTL